MKKRSCWIAGFVAWVLLQAVLAAPLMAQYALPAAPAVEARAQKILGQMTLDEKMDYVGGFNSFYIRAIPRLGVPELKMSDGPLGTRNDGPSTAYPAGILMASTWDVALAQKFGESLGMDSRARGVHFILAPGMNIYRAPMCGRNFEYFGEDPFLASRMAVAEILGIQSEGVIATAKHYMGNNQEWERYKVSSDIDERTMREIYLPAFEASIKEGHVGAVMDSYNLVNGEHATQNFQLNTQILKRDWGFQGILMSDWDAVTDGLTAATSGLDLEMPAATFMNRKTLGDALASGKLTQAQLDDKVLRILRTAIAFGFFDRAQKDASIPLDNPSARAVALKTAEEGVVLLTNKGILPLDASKYKKIAVIGPDANPAVAGAGGSSQISPLHPVSILDGMRAELAGKAELLYASGLPLLSEIIAETPLTVDAEGTQPGMVGAYYNNTEMKGEPALQRTDRHIAFDWGEGSYADGQPVDNFSARWVGYYTPKTSGNYTFDIQGDDGFRLFVDDKPLIEQWQYQGEALVHRDLKLEAGHHYKIRVEYFEGTGQAKISFGISSNSREPLEKAVAVARQADAVVLAVGFDKASEGEGSDRPFTLPEAQRELIAQVLQANKNVVIVLNAGGNVDMVLFREKAAAILHAWYPGQEGGTAVAELLTGKVNPSGKLPATFERRWEDNPVHDSYYDKNNSRRVQYSEGIFVGYRGYEKNGTRPEFPFGYGLSYTRFHYSGLKLTRLDKDRVEVSFTVTNTGARDGAEVTQVYVADRHAPVVRPRKELKGFARTELKAGESRTVTVTLTPRAFQYYDVNAKGWTMAPGKFDILVGGSSARIALKGVVELGK
ncbi:MAG: glycoside hydrolase family 3 C-terminal domain-containing protein [Acidobacteriota bacterium]|nr:glycoside hydrolase family 3 C-terminal domain-containing protein [Acidobacteriota bacterium]